MRVRLAYGRSGLDVELEEATTTVVEPVHRPPVADPAAARAPFDVVVTTNAGFPLDQNLYQSVKGISAAFQVTRPRRADRLHRHRGNRRRSPGRGRSGRAACVLPEGPQTIPYLAPAGSAPGHQEAKMRAWPPEPCS